jgi:Tol biopolymer transport system component
MLSKRFVLYCLVGMLITSAVMMSCQNNNIGGDNTGAATDDAGVDKPPVAGLLSLTVMPATATLTVDNVGAPKTQQYQAIGHFDGQPDRDVTSAVNWMIDNPSIGSVSAGLFTTSNQAGGSGTITAYSGSISAKAQIAVLFLPVISDPSAPSNASTVLPTTSTGSVVAGSSPTIIYPSNLTMFPRNIYKILFSFTGGTGNDLYRLEFKSPQMTLSVWTSSTSWTPNATQWGYMANTNAGGKVTWTVYATNKANPVNVYRSNPIDIQFSKSPVEGAIYYWSTTVAGVRRATVSDSAPSDFLTPAQINKCVACHTMSRNGTRIAADIGGNVLGVYNVKDQSVVINPNQNIAMAWTTFNPDTTRIVTASKGILTLRDGNTGTSLGNITLPASKYGTMPDWSPDGSKLVFTYSAVNKDRGISGSSIATMDYNGTGFANLKVLVQSTGNSDSKYYPSFSPDSKWIAYVSAAGGNSDNNDAAKLYIISTDGTVGPIDLGKANTIVNNQTLTGAAAQLADTMPTWAPTKPGETMFIAFTTARAYATVYAAGKYKQMWVAGVDPTALSAGQDPSFPGFRLPFQDATENSHRPFWATDVINPPPPPPADGGTGMCLPINTDCSSGQPCCSGLFCSSTGGGPPYSCQLTVG